MPEGRSLRGNLHRVPQAAREGGKDGMKEIQTVPCPFCHEETPYARAYGVDYRTYWCPTCHEYVDVDDVEEDE